MDHNDHNWHGLGKGQNPVFVSRVCKLDTWRATDPFRPMKRLCNARASARRAKRVSVSWRSISLRHFRPRTTHVVVVLFRSATGASCVRV